MNGCLGLSHERKRKGSENVTAIEQSEDAHTVYVFHMSFEYHPKQLVFVDKVLVITDSLEGMVTQQEDAV